MKMRLPKRFFEPKPSVLPQRPKTEKGPEKFDIPTPRVLDSNRKLLGQSRKKDEMELKDGQKFRAVITGTVKGKRYFKSREFVSSNNQETELFVDEQMGMPAQDRVFVYESGKSVPELVIRGSIEPIDIPVLIQYVNTSNYSWRDTDVEVHGADCTHVRKYKFERIWWADADAGLARVTSAEEAWREYNADFLTDNEPWDVWVFPCSGLVYKTQMVVDG